MHFNKVEYGTESDELWLNFSVVCLVFSHLSHLLNCQSVRLLVSVTYQIISSSSSSLTLSFLLTKEHRGTHDGHLV